MNLQQSAEIFMGSGGRGRVGILLDNLVLYGGGRRGKGIEGGVDYARRFVDAVAGGFEIFICSITGNPPRVMPSAKPGAVQQTIQDERGGRPSMA
ncbi:MAG: hypothetical protein POG74_09135 [Acidocella sp.]|nr:hypothetical protein [Acidocella sp.]